MIEKFKWREADRFIVDGSIDCWLYRCKACNVTSGKTEHEPAIYVVEVSRSTHIVWDYLVFTTDLPDDGQMVDDWFQNHADAISQDCRDLCTVKEEDE